jgi:hypothetical protein
MKTMLPIRLLRPSQPLPEWLPLVPEFSHKDPRQWARIGCWAISWMRGSELWIRPVFGGPLILLECAGAEMARVVSTSIVGVKRTPLLPMAEFQQTRLLQFGEVAGKR